MESLLSTARLAEHLGDPGLFILDASAHLPATGRDAQAEFAEGHIPGAHFLDLATLRDAGSDVPAALPTGAQVAARLASLGWRASQSIVLYDDSAIKTSARAWFALRRAGVASAILDGGFSKWRAKGRPVEGGQPAEEPVAAADLVASDGLVRSKADILANLSAKREQVVDARDGDRFTGSTTDTVHGLPGGHIPGARNLHYRDLYRDDGTFRPLHELRATFVDAGVDLTRPIVTTCGSGVTASVLLFALHLIGVDDAALYDGSWAEWGADPHTPKETGAA